MGGVELDATGLVLAPSEGGDKVLPGSGDLDGVGIRLGFHIPVVFEVEDALLAAVCAIGGSDVLEGENKGAGRVVLLVVWRFRIKV